MGPPNLEKHGSSAGGAGPSNSSNASEKKKKVEKKPDIVQQRAINLRDDVTKTLAKARAEAKNTGQYFDFPAKPNSSDREISKPDGCVLANYFKVKLREEIDLFKYRITIGEIHNRVPKKKETKKAMIKSLMESIDTIRSQNNQPNLLWVSDFDSLVITTSKIFDDSNINDPSILVHEDTTGSRKNRKYIKQRHERDGTPAEGCKQPIVSDVTYEDKVELQDLQTYMERSTSGSDEFSQFQKAMQVLEILNIISWKQIHNNLDIGIVGRKFYPKIGTNPGEVDEQRGGKFDIFPGVFYGRLGFFTSMRNGGGKTLLNVNTTTTVFFEEVTLDAWLLSSVNPFKDMDKRIEEVKSAKVEVLNTEPNLRTVFEITQDASKQTFIENDEKEATDLEKESIEQHMKNSEGRWVQEEADTYGFYVNLGSEQHPDWYHAKFVQIKAFQPYKKALQNDIMVRVASKSPRENKDRIRDCALKALGISSTSTTPAWNSNPILSGFCVSDISEHFTECPARFLKRPQIFYANRTNKTITKGGGWDNAGVTYVRVGETGDNLLHVIVINEQSGGWKKDEFIDGLNSLANSLRNNGIQVLGINKTEIRVGNLKNRNHVVAAMDEGLLDLETAQPNAKIPLILVVLPEKHTELHSSVKWWGDCKKGKITICAVQSKFRYKPPKGAFDPNRGRGASRGYRGGSPSRGPPHGGGSYRGPRNGGGRYRGSHGSHRASYGGDGQYDSDSPGHYVSSGGEDNRSRRGSSHSLDRGGNGQRGARGGGNRGTFNPNVNTNNNRQGGYYNRNGENSNSNNNNNRWEADQKIMGNLSLKFNFKLKGTNHVLGLRYPDKLNNTMIMGADVTHSGRRNPCPSLAAVVASYSTDPEYSSHYPGSARVQRSHMEYIEDLEGMVKERVLYWFYHDNRKTLPESILFYRDGVSESQFPMVKDLEFKQIRAGFEAAATEVKLRDSKVKITLLVVGKRHHTRFYPKEVEVDNNNLDAGLLVDSVVTDPNQFSFYLQSHHSPLGTARSAHYFVIKNEMELQANDLYEFTMNLCYTTSKSVMPLSICPPAKYADRLCERLRCYMRPALDNAKLHPDDGSKSVDGMVRVFREDGSIWATRNNEFGRNNTNDRRNPWHRALDDVMFYL